MKVHTAISHQDAIAAAGPAWELTRSSAQILCYSADNESRVPTAGAEDPGFTSVDSDCHRIGLLRGAWRICGGTPEGGCARFLGLAGLSSPHIPCVDSVLFYKGNHSQAFCLCFSDLLSLPWPHTALASTYNLFLGHSVKLGA